MKTRYFIVSPDAARDGRIVLDGPEFHHSVRVSRVRAGETVRLIDGQGGVYEATVERIESDRAIMRVCSFARSSAPFPVDIAVGVIRAPRFEIAVEKCVELGARAIIPFHSQRCVRRAGETGEALKVDRLNRIVAASCKQSGRAHVPSITLVESFETLVERIPAYGGAFLADPGGAETAVSGGLKGGVLGIVGPEGGISSAERDLLIGAGAVPLSLGRARLRSETAAICLLYRLLFDYALALGVR